MSSEDMGAGDHRTRPKWLGYLQFAVVLAAIGVALYFARAPSKVERVDPVASGLVQQDPVVAVVRPSVSTRTLTLDLTGAIGLRETTRVTSEITGRVIWVSPEFRNGGSITANEPFVKLDPAPYELRVAAASGSLEEAEAAVRLQRARGDADAAALAEARAKRARAALELSELQLARTEIALPYDARVISAGATVGEVVGPAEHVGAKSAVLGVVYQAEALEVVAPIETSDIAFMKPLVGRSARVVTEAGTHDVLVERVSSVIDPKTRLAEVFLRFQSDAAKSSLPLPGMFAELEIDGPSYEGVFLLPYSVSADHVAGGEDPNSVWLVRDGQLATQYARALGRTEEGWLVEAFDAGEGVVVGALPGAREGSTSRSAADGCRRFGDSPVSVAGSQSPASERRTAAAGGLFRYFVENPVASSTLLAVLLVAGILAAPTIPVQEYPPIDLRRITVTVDAPGTSAAELEEDVVRRVEQVLVGLSGVNRVISTANDGRAVTGVELMLHANTGEVLHDVKSAIDGIERFPPPNAEEPEVKVERLAVEVISLAVTSPFPVGERPSGGLRGGAVPVAGATGHHPGRLGGHAGPGGDD